MAEIKQFKPSTKENPRPEKPAEIFDFETARANKQRPQETLPKNELHDLETEEVLKTVLGMIEKIFAESTDKELVTKRLHLFLEKLEHKMED